MYYSIISEEVAYNQEQLRLTHQKESDDRNLKKQKLIWSPCYQSKNLVSLELNNSGASVYRLQIDTLSKKE